MDTLPNYILAVTAIVATVQWFFNARKDRKNAIILKRLEFRGEAFRSFLDVVNMIRNHTDENGQVQIDEESELKKLKMLVQHSLDLFNLYCNKFERDAMNRLAEAWAQASKGKEGDQIIKEIRAISNLIIEQTRTDLRIAS